MQTIDIPVKNSELVLKESEIIKLRKRKLLSAPVYLYLAILCSYGSKEVTTIDQEWFCEHWDISASEFLLSLAQLQKKGFLRSEPERFVQLELFFGED